MRRLTNAAHWMLRCYSACEQVIVIGLMMGGEKCLFAQIFAQNPTIYAVCMIYKRVFGNALKDLQAA